MVEYSHMKKDEERDIKIEEILTRGVEDIIVKEGLKKQLIEGKKLRIKFGIDPTGPTLHLGRAVVLRKLRAFQDLGHTAVLIVGDFTALIGDPSDKLEKRPMLTPEKIKENLLTYKKQLGKIVDLEKNIEIHFNSTWLSKLSFMEIALMAESFTVQQMAQRRNFKERLENGDDISLREFLYPLMQGYDSVHVHSDVEIGGFDQLFNVKAGRIMQEHYKQTPQNILTTSMLVGTDGRKMSTSWGNIISIVDTPEDMYGKIMSVKDDLLVTYFILCTDLSISEIKTIEENLIKEKMHPRDAKMFLAREIVTLYHGLREATKAENYFVSTFSKGEIPKDAKRVVVKMPTPLVDLLVQNKVVASKSEFRRLVEDGAITFHGEQEEKKIIDPQYVISESGALKIGKRRFLKIAVTNNTKKDVSKDE